MVPGFGLQEHGESLDIGREVWGPLGTSRAAGRILEPMWNAGGLVQGLTVLRLQGGALGALWVKRSQGEHREGHCVLQGCRRPWQRCRERLGVSEHFALRVHNHCRGGGEEGSRTLWVLFLRCLGTDCKKVGGPWLCWEGLGMLGGPG